MSDENKTHFRKAFNSPYLSSADVVGTIVLTIARVGLEPDRTKKTKDSFNTAHFVEKEIRKGEELKPMIMNAGNSKILEKMSGSVWLEDWLNMPVTIYVGHDVRQVGGGVGDGLKVSPEKPKGRPNILPTNQKLWNGAITAYKRDGNFEKVLARADISEENQKAVRSIVEAMGAQADEVKGK